jgi:hypothetical protein
MGYPIPSGVDSPVVADRAAPGENHGYLRNEGSNGDRDNSEQVISNG